MKARMPAGFGRPDMNSLMRQAQKMQEDMKAKQAELEAAEYTGSASGEMVTVKMNGKHEVLSITIKPEAVDPDDIEMLEDLVAAAVNATVKQVDEYLEKISRERDQALAQAREEMMENITDTEEQIVDVACKLIQKLTGILVDDYKPVMIYMINQVLNEDEDSRKFVIRVSEENYTYIADNADRLSGAANPGITIEIFSDTKLQKGQCQIESDTGIVDLSMDVQVRNLITAIKLLSTQ